MSSEVGNTAIPVWLPIVIAFGACFTSGITSFGDGFPPLIALFIDFFPCCFTLFHVAFMLLEGVFFIICWEMAGSFQLLGTDYTLSKVHRNYYFNVAPFRNCTVRPFFTHLFFRSRLFRLLPGSPAKKFRTAGPTLLFWLLYKLPSRIPG